jgi:inhibitor of KinA sporulation pathway (predicted exonuclease)
MRYIALDLELEQPKTNTQTKDSVLDKEKIIQVGWLVFEVSPDEKVKILKTQRRYVYLGVPLSKFIKKLTNITDEELDNGESLVDIFEALKKDQKDFDTSRVIREWGSGDMSQLRLEVVSEVNDTKMTDSRDFWPFGRSGFNVKHLFQAYAYANNKKSRGGLLSSMKKMGLSWINSGFKDGGQHDATNDAINTAYVYCELEKLFKKS